MDLFVFYGLAALIFMNAAVSSLVLLPRIHNSRFLFSAILSLFLAISTFFAFLGTNWAILSLGFGIYCFGQMLDCLIFSGKTNKSKNSFLLIYAIVGVGSIISFAWGLKILFMFTYIGYWFLNFVKNKGFLNSPLIGSKEK